MNKVFRSALLLVCLLQVGSVLFGQTTIKGTLVDDDEEALPVVTLMLVTKSDSVLAGFAMTDQTGAFEMKGIAPGEYLLQGSLAGKDPLNRLVKVEAGVDVADLGIVQMMAKSTEVGGVEITAEEIPIQIKGDTIEYNADAFKTRPNANVEELLKRLPGVEVDSDGNIKSQGETVQKILVDGKEFFGDDPKVASKNLPAEAVDKVQAFDKLSDMAEFTGVDDGEQQKTLNLVLKEDHKTGYFGNVSAGYGSDDRFEGRANINRFNDKSQLSFLGMGNNTNEQAFSWNDYINFMGGIGNLISMSDAGGQGFSPDELGLPIGFGQNSGVTTTGAAGLNFNQDIGKKTELMSSYFFNYLNKDLQQSTYRENILEGTSFTTEDTSVTDDKNYNHRVNLRLKHELTDNAQLIFRGNGSINTTDGITSTETQSLTGTSLQNSSIYDQITDGNLSNLTSNLTYRQRFKKKGRSMAIDFSFGYNGTDRLVDLLSVNSFSVDTLGMLTDTINQEQRLDQKKQDFGGKITYIEPVGKKKFLEVKYVHQENANDLVKDFYNVDGTEVRDYDSLLSNRYDGGWVYDQASTALRIIPSKMSNIQIGVGAQRSALDGVVGLQDTTIAKEFFNVLPSFRWNYSPRKGRKLRLRYTTAINAPSIENLQPVVDNSNPLSIYIGNPELDAEYAHNMRLSYMLFDQFSFTSLFTSLSATYTGNKISQSTTVDSLFRQVTTPVNVDRDLRISARAHFNTPIRKLGVKIGANPVLTYTNGITLINGVENPTNRLTSTMDFSIENRKKEWLDILVGARVTHNTTQYEIDASMNQEYLNTSYYTDLTIYFLKKWTFNTRFDYYVYSGGGFSENQTVPLWKAYVSRTFFESDKLELKFYVFDILNQNAGIDRTTQVNYLEESRYNTVSRYGMFSATWKIISLGKKK